jgi:hypothetical protein
MFTTPSTDPAAAIRAAYGTPAEDLVELLIALPPRPRAHSAAPARRS